MASTFDLVFEWPHTNAHTVIATGTFDNWSSSLHLKRTDSGFTGSVAVPWDSKILYKFIVDGTWVTHGGQPTETDGAGFVNNVARTPAKPEISQPIEPAGKESAAEEVAPVPVPEVDEAPVATLNTPEEAEKEVPKIEAQFEVAPDVPVVIEPVLDATANIMVEAKPIDSESGPSTHEPAPAPEELSEPQAAPEPEAISTPKPAPEEAPTPATEPTPEVAPVAAPEPTSTPTPPAETTPKAATPAPEPEKKAAEAAPPAPSTPPPMKLEFPPPAPVTPIKLNGTAHARSSTGTSTPPSSSAPSTPKKERSLTLDEGSSPGRMSLGRKKRQSFFGKIKAAFSPDKEKKKRLGSMSPRSASPTPMEK